MADNILSANSAGGASGKIYKHSGFSSTILDSFSSPSTACKDISYDGTNAYSLDSGTDKIYKLSGFSSSISNSFSTPLADGQGLTTDGTDIYSTDITSDKIYKHSGFSSSIADSFSSPSTVPNGITWGTSNLYSCDSATDKIYKHSGFSITILDSFSSPGIQPTSVSWDGTNVYSCDNSAEKIYKHSGFSNTVSDSFSSPTTSVNGLEWENFDARTGITNVTLTPSVKSLTINFPAPIVIAENPNVTITPAVLSLIVTNPSVTVIIPDVHVNLSVMNLIVTPNNTNVKIRSTSSFAIKIISYNPLIFISDTNPIQLTRVSTTSPDNPTWEVQLISGFSNPTSVSVDTTNGWIYIGCADGLIAQIDIDDLSNYSALDVTDASDFLNVGSLSAGYLVYGSTNETTGEAYLIDQRGSTTIDTNFQAIVELVGIINLDFNTIEGQTFNTDFKVLAETENSFRTNFVCLNSTY